MNPQCTRIRAYIVALVAFVWLFSTVRFQMRPCIHIGCICMTFLQCESSNVSSNCLHKRMHNHTGCICLIFLHYASSNASLKLLHKRMHSRIGCICLAFPHCVFSNDLLKHVHMRIHNHTGCICLTFLHCVSSNVSSKRLHKRIHSRIGCIFFIFPPTGFQMTPQITRLRACIVTLVTFVCLFSTVYFQIFP